MKTIDTSLKTTNLPLKRTCCSLNKKEILQLPGFGGLKEYLCKELKKFVRDRITNEFKCKKRGFTVKQYCEIFEKQGSAYVPKHKTERVSVRVQSRNKATNKLMNKVKEKAEKREFANQFN